MTSAASVADAERRAADAARDVRDVDFDVAGPSAADVDR